MPRQARLDAPGLLHHVMQRGVARKRVFADQADREEFLRRLAEGLARTETACYAWCLMPNHLHFLLRTGNIPMGRLLQSVLGGYSGYFNRRHERIGHLFQGRFKSVICEEEPYFLEVVRYIHLNPVRAGIVNSMDGLEKFPWSGHAVLLGRREASWQDTGEVLGRFGSDRRSARDSYRAFVAERLEEGRSTELEGGGIIRSTGGLVELSRDRGKEHHVSDERILGREGFIRRVLKGAEMRARERRKSVRSGLNPQKVLERAAKVAGVSPADLKGWGRKRRQSEGRALFCKWMVEDLGYSGARVAGILGVTKMAVWKAVGRGRELEAGKRGAAS